MNRRAFFASLGFLPGAIAVQPDDETLATRYMFFVRHGSAIMPEQMEALVPGSILYEEPKDVAIFDIKEGKMVRDFK